MVCGSCLSCAIVWLKPSRCLFLDVAIIRKSGDVRASVPRQARRGHTGRTPRVCPFDTDRLNQNLLSPCTFISRGPILFFADTICRNGPCLVGRL